jgi:hypothetical protein
MSNKAVPKILQKDKASRNVLFNFLSTEMYVVCSL